MNLSPDTLLLTDGEEQEPAENDSPSSVAPPQGITITKKDRAAANKALKASGLTTLHLPRLEAKSELGKHFVRLGLFQIAATSWVVTGEDLESTFAKIVELDAELKEPESRAELMRCRVEILKQRAELIRIGFKAGEIEMRGHPENKPSHALFPANTAVQINNYPPATVEVVK